MTQIDCVAARKYWKKKGKDECDYLEQDRIHLLPPDKAVRFVTTDYKNIFIPTDEESNDYHVLTPKVARHVAKKLIGIADILERRKGK
jgi:hypothetical protein